MELRSRPGISGSQTKPRATSEGRKAVGTNRINQADNVNNMTCVNSPSSPSGIARGGKSPSRILPTEGGRSRAVGPQPRSESAGGADRSPEGDPPRRRGQTRESGDAGGRATPGRKPGVVAAVNIPDNPTKVDKNLHYSPCCCDRRHTDNRSPLALAPLSTLSVCNVLCVRKII